MEYDFSKQAQEFLESQSAKRPGPKSGAQTPAKKSEKKEGSSKNEKGSAGKDGKSITFSDKVISALKNKVKEHNDPPSLVEPYFEMHLLLNLNPGDTIETEKGGKIVLTDEYTAYNPYKVGSWIKKGKWTLRVPKDTRFIFPYALYNSYSLYNYPPKWDDQKLGIVICSFPSKEDVLKCSLTVKP